MLSKWTVADMLAYLMMLMTDDKSERNRFPSPDRDVETRNESRELMDELDVGEVPPVAHFAWASTRWCAGASAAAQADWVPSSVAASVASQATMEVALRWS